MERGDLANAPIRKQLALDNITFRGIYFHQTLIGFKKNRTIPAKPFRGPGWDPTLIGKERIVNGYAADKGQFPYQVR